MYSTGFHSSLAHSLPHIIIFPIPTPIHSCLLFSRWMQSPVEGLTSWYVTQNISIFTACYTRSLNVPLFRLISVGYTSRNDFRFQLFILIFFYLPNSRLELWRQTWELSNETVTVFTANQMPLGDNNLLYWISAPLVLSVYYIILMTQLKVF